MRNFPEGNAIIYCEGAFNTPNGKTAHGLVRFTERYQVLAVIDSQYAGQDAGLVLDRTPKNIPIYADLQMALTKASATHFVIGLAPDGGRLSENARAEVKKAIIAGLHVDCGLHDFLSDDSEIAQLAAEYQINIRDIRKTPSRKDLHFFSGKIEDVPALKIAVLGTDSAIGKRTTAWVLVHTFRRFGYRTEMIGTGQTGWLQGAKYSIILDSLINDFVAGEIEHAIWSAWYEEKPEVIVIEGQGSLMNPAYPGGFEIIAAGRPDAVVLQHAPARKEYDGFPGYPLHPLSKQIQAIELLSEKSVAAITINHEDLELDEIPLICTQIEMETGLPTIDVLLMGADKLIEPLLKYRKNFGGNL